MFTTANRPPLHFSGVTCECGAVVAYPNATCDDCVEWVALDVEGV